MSKLNKKEGGNVVYMNLINTFFNDSFDNYQWNPDVFLRGGVLFSESDLRRVNVFTKEDAERMKKLEDELENPYLKKELREAIKSEARSSGVEKSLYLISLLDNPKKTNAEDERECVEMFNLRYKKDTEQWVSKAYNGQVSIKMTFGRAARACGSDYEEYLEIKGDDILTGRVFSTALATEADKINMTSKNTVLVQEIPGIPTDEAKHLAKFINLLCAFARRYHPPVEYNLAPMNIARLGKYMINNC